MGLYAYYYILTYIYARIKLHNDIVTLIRVLL